MGRRRSSREIRYILPVGERPVFVTRKSIKNLYIRIGDDLSVRVSAPLRCSDEEIRRFVADHEAWICRHRDERAAVLRQEEEQKAKGLIPLWGREVPWEGTPLTGSMRQRMERLTELYRRETERKLAELAPRCEALTGKKASVWKVRKMKSSWGNCQTRTGEIHINLYLAAQPVECLEYVIIHELVHLYAPDHGPRFRAYMDRFLPDWRERRAMLKRR